MVLSDKIISVKNVRHNITPFDVLYMIDTYHNKYFVNIRNLTIRKVKSTYNEHSR